jgi:hypothetical protein
MAENGREARSSFIEKGILYTVSQFLSSLDQYRLYVRVGKHVLSTNLRPRVGNFDSRPLPNRFRIQNFKNVKIPLDCLPPPPPPSQGENVDRCITLWWLFPGTLERGGGWVQEGHCTPLRGGGGGGKSALR